MANTDKNKVLDLQGLNRYDELLKQMITTHTSNKDNPHEVTKDQIGLSSVENKSVAEILAAMTAEDVTTALGYTPQKQGAGGGSYGFASENEAGVIMSGGDISVSEDGIVSVTGMNGLNVGSDVRPIYFKDGKPVEGYYTLAEAASKSITNITEATNLGWLNTSVGGLFVPSLNTLAFWNGEYAEGMSNIEYFKLGKFGSMATRSEDEYLETGDIADWAKAENKPEYTYTEVGADKAGAADTALASAKEYALNTVNTKIAELINSAPETMDTLGELAMLMTSNQEAVDILNEAIAKKATTSDLTAHTGNTSNPHGVTKAQVGLDKVDNTADADKSVKHAISTDSVGMTGLVADMFRPVWIETLDSKGAIVGKPGYNMAFQYNPGTDTLKVGNITGKANSAITADALAVATAVGSATNPVYIDATGKPVKTTYTLGASVPADAKFTDTTYTLESFGLTATADELNYVDGVTSNIQTQLDSKAPSEHEHYQIDIRDSRDDAFLPLDMKPDSASLFFRKDDMPIANWYSGINMTGWTTAYNSWQLIGSACDGAREDNLYFRNGANDSWFPWRTLVDSKNYSSVIPAATRDTAGLLSASDKLKLDKINHECVIDLTDTTIYDENTWYPCTSTTALLTGKLSEIIVYTVLDKMGVPSWASHASGFICNLTLLAKAGGWGATEAHTIVLDYSYRYVGDYKFPHGYSQMDKSSTPVIWLRGGGHYHIITDFICTWEIHTEAYTKYDQTVEPRTDGAPFEFNKSTIYAHLRGKINGFTVETDVPANAKFTDTTYSAATTSAAGLMSAADKTTLDNVAKTYLPLTGGYMSRASHITIPSLDGGRWSKIAHTGITFGADSTGGWAEGITYTTNDGKTVLGGFGGYGTTDKFAYYYIGESCDTAKIRAYNSGVMSMTKLMATSAVIDEKVTLAYSDTTDSLSFNFA